MVERTEYLEKIKAWREEQVIKVVTGIRRCGKSTLLQQYRDYLLSTGVSSEQIIFINFEELEYEELQDYHKLYSYITERLISEKYTYIFLDEIQKVDSFEKVVDSLYVKNNTDIYITGSNSKLLSKDINTKMRGRSIEIKVYPLSFAEFYDYYGGEKRQCFNNYLMYGGLPYLLSEDVK